jgi:hypothetical protein
MFKKLLGQFGKHKHRLSANQHSSELSSKRYYLAICCIIKDENEYLEEWISYHLKTGVQHFYIYDNESSTPINDTLSELNLLKYATVTRIDGKAKQVEAYAHCLSNFGPECAWIAFIDIDEFIVAKSTGGNLAAFLKGYETFGGLGINWLIFGSNGHAKKTGRPQLESFTMRTSEHHRLNTHTKSIVQPRFVKSAFNAHFFHYIRNKFCVNENFTPISGAFSKVSVNKIQLNHYFCRSVEEFSAKQKRGRGDTGEERTMEEFYTHDKVANAVKDTAILYLFK